MAQKPGAWSYDTQGYASYQSGAPAARSAVQPSESFVRLTEMISGGIQRMVLNVSQIDGMNGLIGTASDNPELRDRLHKLQHETNQLAHKISQQIKELTNVLPSQIPEEQRQRKLHKEKLMDEFTTVLKNFQSSQRRQKDKEKEAIQRTKSKATSPTDPYAEEELANGQMVGVGSAKQQTSISVEDDFELLQDRERNVRQLEADITDVNQIFKDLSVLVHEQGEVIDCIEANVESTSLNIARGTEQLRTAHNYKAKIREKKCCLIITAVVIIVIVAIIIGVSVNH